MNALYEPAADWVRSVLRGWDQFWFTPAQPHTLAIIRILGGAMLLYTHAVWALDLEAFLGRHSWLSANTVALLNQELSGRNYAWRHLYWVDLPALLWTMDIAAHVVSFLLAIGLLSRVRAFVG